MGIDYGRAKTYTVGNWLEVWYENYAKIKMRPSTYLTYHGYIENHIKPQLGKIPLNDLTTLHLQQFYKKLLAEGRVERIEAQKQPKGRSRWGQRLGQKKWQVRYWTQKRGKSPDFARNQDFLVRVVIQNFLKKPVISTVFKADE